MPTEPIVLYTNARGPVPWRVAIILEELGVPYVSKYVESPEMNSEPFKSLNPNGKVPAIEDPNTGIRLFEAGAIILYLLDTYDTSGTLHSISGLNNQHVWFSYKHPEHVQFALDRYEGTIKRTIRMLDEYLKDTGKSYLTGDRVSFADLVFVVTNELVPQLLPGYDWSEEYPHYARWNSAAALGQPLGVVDQKHIDNHTWRNDPNHKW
ncbi:hypothetical protein ABHI18_005217 [Aspergillus niger]